MLAYFLCILFVFVPFAAAVWFWINQSKNVAVIDVAWGIGIALCGIVHLSLSFSMKTGFVAFLLLLWVLRLSGYLWWTRVRKGLHDPRYESLQDINSNTVATVAVKQIAIQTILMAIIVVPFFMITARDCFSLMDIVATDLVLMGIVGSSVADWQLYHFRKQASTRVCTSGLWAYSRHPNYFFEIIVWLGFASFALSTTAGLLAFISPLCLWLVMIFVTIPLTEKMSLASKGEVYQAYQSKTPRLCPVKRR